MDLLFSAESTFCLDIDYIPQKHIAIIADTGMKDKALPNLERKNIGRSIICICFLAFYALSTAFHKKDGGTFMSIFSI